ncbi:hypothetical protein L2E82_50435 [Cichorium intybus]|nr:hypothetical protein L2E82_50435 [Cichorium intybus]
MLISRESVSVETGRLPLENVQLIFHVADLPQLTPSPNVVKNPNPFGVLPPSARRLIPLYITPFPSSHFHL